MCTPTVPLTPSDLINPFEAAFLGVSSLAALGAAVGALRALRFLKGSFEEANKLNRLTLEEIHRRVRPRIALRGESQRTTEPPMAFDAGLVISGQDNIHEVTLRLDLGEMVECTCEPDYFDFLEPATKPITLRWKPISTPTLGTLSMRYLDSLGKKTLWTQRVLADNVGLKPQGRPSTVDDPADK